MTFEWFVARIVSILTDFAEWGERNLLFMEKDRVGFYIRNLSNLIQRRINQMVAREEESLTGRQVWILGFLVRQGDRETVQRDVEKEFSMRRSTASHMLTLMENHGYIRRVPVPRDARLKRIVLTEKGRQAQERMTDRLRRFEALMRDGMTDEEVEGFLVMLGRLEKNIL